MFYSCKFFFHYKQNLPNLDTDPWILPFFFCISIFFLVLIPLTHFDTSQVTLSNICVITFSLIESHAWLLGEDVEVAARLLLPLAGPDVFTLEENDSLPIDLQYLPDDKTREPDPEIRKLLLEALMQVIDIDRYPSVPSSLTGTLLKVAITNISLTFLVQTFSPRTFDPSPALCILQGAFAQTYSLEVNFCFWLPSMR